MPSGNILIIKIKIFGELIIFSYFCKMFSMNANKDGLITHVITHGKDKSWYELAKKFNIRPGATPEQRKKAANDIWRAYKRKHSNNEGDNPQQIIKKRKEWQTYDGKVRESIEYDIPSTNALALLDQVKDDFIKDAKNHSTKYPKVFYKKPTSRTVLEISIPDLHLGQLAWDKESGEDYDIDIAKSRFIEAIEYFKNGCGITPEKYLFVIGNDFFNSDSLEYTTTAGTPQQDDSRWQKSFTEGRRLIVQAIDSLREKAPVDVLVIPGNHDFQRSFYLGDSIECWYNNCREVVVHNEPLARKYYRYGVNLLGFTHGKEEKPVMLPILMASEAPKDWAETKHREWHLGHLHKTFVDENFGVVTRILPSLTSTDSWHKLKGFVGNVKAAQAYLWDHSQGYKAHFQYTV
jgi:hypothetical protein